jgi:hypothetical protein
VEGARDGTIDGCDAEGEIDGVEVCGDLLGAVVTQSVDTVRRKTENFLLKGFAILAVDGGGSPQASLYPKLNVAVLWIEVFWEPLKLIANQFAGNPFAESIVDATLVHKLST